MSASKAAAAGSKGDGARNNTRKPSLVKRVLPFLSWFEGYSATKLRMWRG